MDAPFKRVLKHLPIAERLIARIEFDTNGGCWLWSGATDGYGYGSLGVARGRTGKAYRVSYATFVGPIPPLAHVLHRCDTPACINPAHLFLGTHRDNMDDMFAKGRNAKGAALPHTTLTENDVLMIRARVAAGETRAAVARDYPVSQPTISRIVSRKRRGGI